jgi:hypothetical protein
MTVKMGRQNHISFTANTHACKYTHVPKLDSIKCYVYFIQYDEHVKADSASYLFIDCIGIAVDVVVMLFTVHGKHLHWPFCILTSFDLPTMQANS